MFLLISIRSRNFAEEGDSIKVSFAQSVASDESVARELGAIIGMVVLDAEPEVVMGLVVDALAIVDLPKSSGAEEATITEMPDEEHFDDADESFESVSVLDTSTTSELASPKVSATLLVDVKLGGVQLNCKHFDSQVAQIVLGHTSATVQVSDQLMVVEASAGPLGLEAGSERVMFTEEKHIATLLFRQTKGLAPDAFVQLRTAPLVLSVSPPSVNALASYGFAYVYVNLLFCLLIICVGLARLRARCRPRSPPPPPPWLLPLLRRSASNRLCRSALTFTLWRRVSTSTGRRRASLPTFWSSTLASCPFQTSFTRPTTTSLPSTVRIFFYIFYFTE